MRTVILIICLALCGTVNGQTMKPLTPEEKRVIVDKGTEAPSSLDQCPNGITEPYRKFHLCGPSSPNLRV